MKLDNNNHSVFALNYHLILVIHCRKKIINKKISDRLQEIFKEIGSSYNITITSWEHETDSLQIQFKAEPNSELSKFINAYKSASSRLVKKEFPTLSSLLSDRQFWSRSFCLITLGEADSTTIKNYIESQNPKTRHKYY